MYCIDSHIKPINLWMKLKLLFLPMRISSETEGDLSIITYYKIDKKKNVYIYDIKTKEI